MGYRSNVVIYIQHPEIHEAVRVLIDKADDEDTNELKHMFIAPLIQATGQVFLSPPGADAYLLVQYEDVKWYDSYLFVQLLQQLYADFEHIDGASTAFCRTGEEADDVDYRNSGDGCDVVYPTTSIEVNI